MSSRASLNVGSDVRNDTIKKLVGDAHGFIESLICRVQEAIRLSPPRKQSGRRFSLMNVVAAHTETLLNEMEEELRQVARILRHTGLVEKQNKTMSAMETIMPPQPVTVPDHPSFPMTLMPVKVFQTLNVLQPHPHAKAENMLRTKLTDGSDDVAVHFVSHEWLGSEHPDPEGMKLRIFQRFFQRVLDPEGISKTFTADDWQAFAMGSANKTHAAARQAAEMAARQSVGGIAGEEHSPETFKIMYKSDVANGCVWMDFFSIPQVTKDMGAKERAAAMEDQIKAIQSIPQYIKQATYFYICAPTAQHETGRICNFNTWQERGWCRMEEASNFLSPLKSMQPIIVTEAPKVRFMEFFDFFLFRGNRRDCSVFNGAFKCCTSNHVMVTSGGHGVPIRCDKEILAPVLDKMLDAKLDALRAAGNGFMLRIFRCMEPALLAGSVFDRLALVCSPDEGPGAFLERFMLPEDPRQGDGSGAPAIEWAAFAGHAPMVEKLLRRGCPADVADKGGLTPLLGGALCCDSETVTSLLLQRGGLANSPAVNAQTKGMGISPLDRAAKGGALGVVRRLLEARASVNCRRTNGCTPLLSAVEGGHAEVIAFLVSARADMGATSNDGLSAMHLAARGFSFFGQGAERIPDVLDVLLRARASVEGRDDRGRTPMDLATEEGNHEFLKCYRACSGLASREDFN